MTVAPLPTAVDHVTVARASPAAAATVSGAVGTAAGVTAADAADTADAPNVLFATTVNCWLTPLVRPSIRHDRLIPNGGESVQVLLAFETAFTT
ncbi:unannotated protein [freshwater metagenome]|uniref:Unannotated protein n=1 Tax=freshwater metagenome TaxID=449393 RepID=A0A6J5YI83_9ZZZZ